MGWRRDERFCYIDTKDTALGNGNNRFRDMAMEGYWF